MASDLTMNGTWSAVNVERLLIKKWLWMYVYGNISHAQFYTNLLPERVALPTLHERLWMMNLLRLVSSAPRKKSSVVVPVRPRSFYACDMLVVGNTCHSE